MSWERTWSPNSDQAGGWGGAQDSLGTTGYGDWRPACAVRHVEHHEATGLRVVREMQHSRQPGIRNHEACRLISVCLYGDAVLCNLTHMHACMYKSPAVMMCRYPHDAAERDVPVKLQRASDGSQDYVRVPNLHDTYAADVEYDTPMGFMHHVPPTGTLDHARFGLLRACRHVKVSAGNMGRKEEHRSADEMWNMAITARRQFKDILNKEAPDGLQSIEPPQRRRFVWGVVRTKFEILYKRHGVMGVPVFAMLPYFRCGLCQVQNFAVPSFIMIMQTPAGTRWENMTCV